MSIGYAMKDVKTSKYLVSNKKDFSSGVLMYLDDANKYYTKIKIIPIKQNTLDATKNSEINVNSKLQDWHSKY